MSRLSITYLIIILLAVPSLLIGQDNKGNSKSKKNKEEVVVVSGLNNE